MIDRILKQEYGGYLPLELNNGIEWFSRYEPNVYRYNSVKAAIIEIISVLNVYTIWIPTYYCPSTTKAIIDTGILVRYYHINENLESEVPADDSDSIVLLTDYFGIRYDAIVKASKLFSNAYIILDCAHDFYAEPIANERCCTVYSAKKFFGVPDGAYLVSTFQLSQTVFSDSCEYSSFLFMAYENGTNSAYLEKRQADEIVATHYGGMSKLAYGLLKNANYDYVAERRKKNCKLLHEGFRSQNIIDIGTDSIPYLYPLLIDERGYFVKKKLVERKIYVPTLWSGEVLEKQGNQFEKMMTRNAIFLPVDQRYGTDDMQWIISVVKELYADENT